MPLSGTHKYIEILPEILLEVLYEHRICYREEGGLLHGTLKEKYNSGSFIKYLDGYCVGEEESTTLQHLNDVQGGKYTSGRLAHYTGMLVYKSTEECCYMTYITENSAIDTRLQKSF